MNLINFLKKISRERDINLFSNFVKKVINLSKLQFSIILISLDYQSFLI